MRNVLFSKQLKLQNILTLFVEVTAFSVCYSKVYPLRAATLYYMNKSGDLGTSFELYYARVSAKYVFLCSVPLQGISICLASLVGLLFFFVYQELAPL